jgi:type III secretion protein J
MRPLAIFLLAFAFVLGGCKQALYIGLGEEEANQMLSVLLENGVAAEKALEGKAGMTLSVPDEEVVRALKILRNKGMPRERFKTLGDIFSGQGMIASPTEEQARLAFAIAQELAETFSNIDGVLTSRAHVVLETHDTISGTTTPASTAIFLRHTPDSPVVDLQGRIKETCAQSVPGLSYNNVSVMLVPAREEIVLPAGKDALWKSPLNSSIVSDEGAADRETNPMIWMGVAALPLAVLLAAGGGVFVWRRRKAGLAQGANEVSGSTFLPPQEST